MYQQIVLKPADKATFSLKLNVEQATEVNANNHLVVLNILSIKYSMYDVKCDVIRVSAIENHRIFNTRNSAMLQTTWYKMLSLWVGVHAK